jgi:hypothetical protein
MSEEEERLETLSEEFEEESIKNCPSLSWSDVADPRQEVSLDSEGSTGTPSSVGADSLQIASQQSAGLLPQTTSSSHPQIRQICGSSVGTTTTAMSGATPMTINTGDGVMVEIALTPCTNQVTTLGGVMFRKEDHAQLSMEKRTELFDKITTKSLDSKFAEMSISLTDVEKDDTYNVAMLVDRVRIIVSSMTSMGSSTLWTHLTQQRILQSTECLAICSSHIRQSLRMKLLIAMNGIVNGLPVMSMKTISGFPWIFSSTICWNPSGRRYWKHMPCTRWYSKEAPSSSSL